MIGTFDFRLLAVWITTDNELIPFLLQMFAGYVSGILNTVLLNTQFSIFNSPTWPEIKKIYFKSYFWRHFKYTICQNKRLKLFFIAYPENFQQDSDVESPDTEAPSKCGEDQGGEREDEEEGGEPAQQAGDHDGVETRLRTAES